MFSFPIVLVFVFFQPVAHLSFEIVKQIKKVLQANKLDITLYVERRFPFGCSNSFLKKKKTGIYQRSDCSVSPRLLHCLCCFSTARAPAVLSQATLHGLQLDQIFWFPRQRCWKSASFGLKISTKPQDRYLKLFKPFCRIFLCSFLLQPFASYIVHNKYIIIMLTGCLCQTIQYVAFFPHFSYCYLYIRLFVNSPQRNKEKTQCMTCLGYCVMFFLFYTSYKNLKLLVLFCGHLFQCRKVKYFSLSVTGNFFIIIIFYSNSRLQTLDGVVG